MDILNELTANGVDIKRGKLYEIRNRGSVITEELYAQLKEAVLKLIERKKNNGNK